MCQILIDHFGNIDDRVRIKQETELELLGRLKPDRCSSPTTGAGVSQLSPICNYSISPWKRVVIMQQLATLYAVICQSFASLNGQYRSEPQVSIRARGPLLPHNKALAALMRRLPMALGVRNIQKKNRLINFNVVQVRVSKKGRISPHHAFAKYVSILWLLAAAGAGFHGTSQHLRCPTHVPPSHCDLRTLLPRSLEQKIYHLP